MSTRSIWTYGHAIRALRRFTMASLNREPEWRQPGPELKSGYRPTWPMPDAKSKTRSENDGR